MENIGVTLKVTGASAAIQAIDNYNKSVDNLWTTLGKGGAAGAVFNSTLNNASTVINNAAKSTAILSAAQTTAALKASDMKNKNADAGGALKNVASFSNEAATGQSKKRRLSRVR
jgi:hypothetical protein